MLFMTKAKDNKEEQSYFKMETYFILSDNSLLFYHPFLLFLIFFLNNT